MTQLRDPDQTKVLIVTLAETTPDLEAALLQEDLRRAGIEPWGWIVNNSLIGPRLTSPFRAIADPSRESQYALRLPALNRDALAVRHPQGEEPYRIARAAYWTYVSRQCGSVTMHGGMDRGQGDPV